MRRPWSFVTALALSAVLSACVGLPSSELAQTARPAREHIVAYSFSGRISAQRTGEGETERYVANITWRHSASNDDILLSSMLGQGIAQLNRSSSGARLLTADQQEFAGPDWEELSARIFGFALPLSELAAWMVALAPNSAEDDRTGRPRHFVADGWRVDYLEYENSSADALPRLIEIKGHNLVLRLKIDQWQEVR